MRRTLNFKPFIENEGRVCLSTVMPLQSWIKKENLQESVDTLSHGSILSDIKVRLLSGFRGLSILSRLFERIHAQTSTQAGFILMQKYHDNEVKDWCYTTGAFQFVLDATASAYNQHSFMLYGASDAQVPAIKIDDLTFQKMKGWDVVKNKGANVLSMFGKIHAPNMNVTDIIGQNYLATSAVAAKPQYQWSGALAKYVKLPLFTENFGLRKEIPFPVLADPNFTGHNPADFINLSPQDLINKFPYTLSMPLHLGIGTDSKSESYLTNIIVNSPVSQKLKISLRNPLDYTNVLDEAKIDIPAGISNISFGIASSPFAPPAVLSLKSDKPAELQGLNINI